MSGPLRQRRAASVVYAAILLLACIPCAWMTLELIGVMSGTFNGWCTTGPRWVPIAASALAVGAIGAALAALMRSVRGATSDADFREWRPLALASFLLLAWFFVALAATGSSPHSGAVCLS